MSGPVPSTRMFPGEFHNFRFGGSDDRDDGRLMYGNHGALILCTSCPTHCLVVPVTTGTNSKDVLAVPLRNPFVEGYLKISSMTYIPAINEIERWRAADNAGYHRPGSPARQLERMRASFPTNDIRDCIEKMLGYREDQYQQSTFLAGRLAQVRLSYPEDRKQYAIILSGSLINSNSYYKNYFVMPVTNYRGRAADANDIEHVDISQYANGYPTGVITFTVKIAELDFKPLISQCQWVKKLTTRTNDTCIPYDWVMGYRQMFLDELREVLY